MGKLLNPEPNKDGIRRINRLPLVIVCCVVVSFIFILMIALSDSAKRKKQVAVLPQQVEATKNKPFVDELVAQKSKVMPSPAPKPEPTPAPANVPPAPERVPVTSQTDREIPTPPELTRLAPLYSPEELQRMRQIEQYKFSQMQDAVEGRSRVAYSAGRGAGGSIGGGGGLGGIIGGVADMFGDGADMLGSGQGGSRTTQDILDSIGAARAQLANEPDPMADVARSQAMASAALMGGVPSLGGAAGAPPPLASFSQGRANKWSSGVGDPEPPTSLYEIRTGAVIPSTLISGINSDVPGQILGQVAQNVYDTATGRYLLIPQGARLIGQYESNVAYGQSRAVVVWNRIVYPDGRALDIGEQLGADMSGYSGFKDRVNTHFFRTIASAILMSGIVAGVELSQNNDDSDNINRETNALSEALGQTLGQAIGQMIMKNMNVSPTIEIRPGYRFNVMVVKDFVFSRPYEAFDY